jgi:hypothetical protein
MEFEDQYQIYPASCITTYEAFVQKRRSWLSRFGLDFWPFSFYNITEKYNECAEIAWAELGSRRVEIENAAKRLLNEDSPFLKDWAEVEDTFGYSLEKDFDGDVSQYVQYRLTWLRRIGMSDTDLGRAQLGQLWKSKYKPEKKQIIIQASIHKEGFADGRWQD